MEWVKNVEEVVHVLVELLLRRAYINIHLAVEIDKLLIRDNTVVIGVDQLVQIKELSQKLFVLAELEAQDCLYEVVEQDLGVLRDLSHLDGGGSPSCSFFACSAVAMRVSQTL